MLVLGRACSCHGHGGEEECERWMQSSGGAARGVDSALLHMRLTVTEARTWSCT